MVSGPAATVGSFGRPSLLPILYVRYIVTEVPTRTQSLRHRHQMSEDTDRRERGTTAEEGREAGRVIVALAVGNISISSCSIAVVVAAAANAAVAWSPHRPIPRRVRIGTEWLYDGNCDSYIPLSLEDLGGL